MNKFTGNGQSLLRIARALISDDDESFTDKMKTIRRGLRGMTRFKNKTLRQMGITNSIRPNALVEEIIDVFVKMSSGRDATNFSPVGLLKGLWILKSQRRKRLKSFGIKKAIRVNVRVSDFILDVVIPMIELSKKEEAQKAEAERVKVETGQIDSTQEGVLPEDGFFEPIENGMPTDAVQPLNTETDIYDAASVANEFMLEWLNRGNGMDAKLGLEISKDGKVVDEPGRVLMLAPLKGKDRAKEKVETEYGGDWAKLLDVVRASIVVDTIEEIEEVLDALRKSGMKMAKKPKDRFSNPTSVGYRDIMINVEYPNGHAGELQIHLKQIFLAKEEGHNIYERVRGIAAKAELKGDDSLTDEEQAIFDSANAEMKELYDEAWMKSIGKMASVFVAADAQYFEYEGHPAVVKRNKYPAIWTTKNAGAPTGLAYALRKTWIYDVEKFMREAQPISKGKYYEMLKKI